MEQISENFGKGTTILTVRKNNQVVMAGDGQVSKSGLILQSNVRNVRRLGRGDVIVGFTGSTVNALLLFEALEKMVSQNPRQLIRACVDVAKFWRQNDHLSRLEAMMVVVNSVHSLILTAAGDVLESEDGIIGIGSGGPYAFAAARALFDLENLSARQIVEKSMNIAADVCIYTNANIYFESIEN